MDSVNKLKIANPSLENEPRTYLTADVDIADVDLPVLATTGFVISGAVDYNIIAGEYGQEKTEIKTVDAGSGTNNTNFKIAALSFSHGASDPITFMRYNQIKIYGATSDGGTKNPIDTIDIDCSQQYTEYAYEGTDYDYFYITYYDTANTGSEKESDYSDVIHSISQTRNSIKRIIESGLRKAMTSIDENSDSKLNWDIAIEVVQDGIDEILIKKRKWSFLRAIKNNTATVLGQQYIDKPDDLSYLQFLIIDQQLVSHFSHFKYNKQTADGGDADTGKPLYFTEKNNKYYLYPTPDAAYDVIYEYYKRPATIISNLSTEINVELIPILIYYCASQFAQIRGNDKLSSKMFALFQKVLEEQYIEFTGPEQAMAESIEITRWENSLI